MIPPTKDLHLFHLRLHRRSIKDTSRMESEARSLLSRLSIVQNYPRLDMSDRLPSHKCSHNHSINVVELLNLLKYKDTIHNLNRHTCQVQGHNLTTKFSSSQARGTVHHTRATIKDSYRPTSRCRRQNLCNQICSPILSIYRYLIRPQLRVHHHQSHPIPKRSTS